MSNLMWKVSNSSWKLYTQNLFCSKFCRTSFANPYRSSIDSMADLLIRESCVCVLARRGVCLAYTGGQCRAHSHCPAELAPRSECVYLSPIRLLFFFFFVVRFSDAQPSLYWSAVAIDNRAIDWLTRTGGFSSQGHQQRYGGRRPRRCRRFGMSRGGGGWRWV